MPAAIFQAVLANLVVAVALAVPAVAVGRWSRRPAVAHAAWLVVLIKLVTPPLLTIPLPVLPAVVTTEAAPPVSVPTHQTGVPTVAVPVIPEPRPTADLMPIRLEPAVESRSTPASSPGPPPAGRPFLPWDAIVVIVWGAGAVGWGWLTLSRARRFGRLLRFTTAPSAELTAAVATAAERIGLLRPPRVRVMPGGVAPLVWGLVRPTLYFPAGLLSRLSADEQLTLIAHELAHVRRGDHLVRPVEFVAAAAYWWCPLVWFARRELRRFEEEACDAEVAGVLPGAGFTYASAVVETIDFLAGARRAPFPASGIGDAGSLRRRLALILDSPSPRPSGYGRLVVLAVGVIAVAFGPKLGRSVAGPVTDLAAGDDPAAMSAPVTDPLSGDEPTAESTHYLTTPTRFTLPAATPDPILAAALSPDGRQFAVTIGAIVTVWDLQAARTAVTMTGHTGTVAAVVFSPDGTHLATAAHDGAVKLWTTTDGREQATFGGHSRWAVVVAFSPDGRILASGGYDATVRLWDVKSGRERAVLNGHTGGVRAVAFSPDGRVVASGGADNEVRLWDAAGGKRLRVLRKHSGSVRAIAYSPDGTRLATGGEDRTVVLWHPTDGREVGSPVGLPDFVSALQFSPTGRTLLAGTDGGHILNIDPVAANPRDYLGVGPGSPTGRPGHAAALVAVLFPPVAGTAYTVAQDRSVAVWPAAGPPEVPAVAFPRHPKSVAAVALTADGRTLASGGLDGSIRLWDADSAALRRTVPAHPGGVTALVFAANGQLVSAGADERVRVWDLTAGRAVRTLTYTTADLRLAPSPDGRLLAVGGPGLPTVTLWDLDTLVPVRHLGGRSGAATAVAFTPDGTGLVTGHADGGVRVWAADSGRELIGGVIGPGQVDGVAFIPDGRTVAAVVNGLADDGPAGTARPVHEVVFLDMGTATVTADRQPLVHPGPITAVAFTCAGVLTAGQNGLLYLWDPAGRLVRAVRGHYGAVRAVAPSPDGAAVFSAGDHSAKRWAIPPLRPGRESSGP